MPAKKSTKQVVAKAEPVQPEPIHEEQVQVQEKPSARPGRTLLVKGNPLDTSVFASLTGVTSTNQSKSPNSYFVSFDTTENALAAFNTLRANESLRVKYSRYRVFFHINGLTESSDYNLVKQDMVNYVQQNTGAQVIFFKLYRKGSKYLGAGDMTVDTFDAYSKMLSKEGNSLKNWNTGAYNGTFYRFNSKSKDSNEGAAAATA